MKQFYFIIILQIVFSVYASAQSETKNIPDSVTWTVSDINEFPVIYRKLFTKETMAPSSDERAFKKLLDSMNRVRYDIFKFPLSLDKSKINKIDFTYRPLPKQKYFFAIHDYSAGWHLRRVSRIDHPFWDNPSGNRFLWSGYCLPYLETGFPRDFYNDDDHSATFIYLIREHKKIRGIGQP